MDIEFKNQNIEFEREKEYAVFYKNKILPHNFYADFVVFDKITLEIKSASELSGCAYCAIDELFESIWK